MSQAAPGDHIPHTPNSSVAKLTLGAIGVVYGDIGTSPLYAMRESLHAASHDGLTRGDVLGVISLLVWTLTLIVTLKYVLLIMRADNNGEGGTLSLVALVQQALKRRPVWLLGLGAVGISLFFGDAIITPAMSVLSAVEGSALVAPGLQAYVVPITLVIIILLFAVQSPQVPPAELIEHIAVFLRECPAADLDAATLEARAFALHAQRCDDALSFDGAAEQAWLDLLAGLAPNHAAAVNQALPALTPDALHRAYLQLCEGPWRVLANAAPPDHWRQPS